MITVIIKSDGRGEGKTHLSLVLLSAICSHDSYKRSRVMRHDEGGRLLFSRGRKPDILIYVERKPSK